MPRVGIQVSKATTTKTKPKSKPATYQAKSKQVSKDIKYLKKELKRGQAHHTHRRRETEAVVASGEDEAVYETLANATNLSTIENSLSNLRYFDSGDPTILDTVAGATGTFNKGFNIESIYKKATARNNYQVPCYVTLMSFLVKADTSQTPTDLYTAGITDQTISGSNTQVLSYITDIDMVNASWKIEKSRSKFLQPGQQIQLVHKTDSFVYNPSQADTQTAPYQKKYRGQIFVVRIEGAIGHDTALPQVASLPCGVDTCVDMVVKVNYDAGIKLNDISYQNNSDSFTNAGVASNKPVSDNQSMAIS